MKTLETKLRNKISSIIDIYLPATKPETQREFTRIDINNELFIEMNRLITESYNQAIADVFEVVEGYDDGKRNRRVVKNILKLKK